MAPKGCDNPPSLLSLVNDLNRQKFGPIGNAYNRSLVTECDAVVENSTTVDCIEEEEMLQYCPSEFNSSSGTNSTDNTDSDDGSGDHRRHLLQHDFRYLSYDSTTDGDIRPKKGWAKCKENPECLSEECACMPGDQVKRCTTSDEDEKMLRDEQLDAAC